MPRFDKSRLPSRYVTEGPEKAPMRAMMLGTGLAPEDLDKPLIGVATTWSESSPCNMPLHDQAQFVKTGVREAGGTPFEFTSASVTDGIANGHRGMKTSLVSRELVAESIELVVRGHCYDAIVGLAGCMISREELHRLEVAACPTIGACPGQYTASTMAAVSEAMGIALPGSGFVPAVDAKRGAIAAACGRTVMDLLAHNIRPRDIVT